MTLINPNTSFYLPTAKLPSPVILPTSAANFSTICRETVAYIETFTLAASQLLNLPADQAKRHILLALEETPEWINNSSFRAFQLVGYLCYPEESTVWIECISKKSSSEILPSLFNLTTPPASIDDYMRIQQHLKNFTKIEPLDPEQTATLAPLPSYNQKDTAQAQSQASFKSLKHTSHVSIQKAITSDSCVIAGKKRTSSECYLPQKVTKHDLDLQTSLPDIMSALTTHQPHLYMQLRLFLNSVYAFDFFKELSRLILNPSIHPLLHDKIVRTPYEVAQSIIACPPLFFPKITPYTLQSLNPHAIITTSLTTTAIQTVYRFLARLVTVNPLLIIADYISKPYPNQFNSLPSPTYTTDSLNAIQPNLDLNLTPLSSILMDKPPTIESTQSVQSSQESYLVDDPFTVIPLLTDNGRKLAPLAKEITLNSIHKSIEKKLQEIDVIKEVKTKYTLTPCILINQTSDNKTHLDAYMLGFAQIKSTSTSELSKLFFEKSHDIDFVFKKSLNLFTGQLCPENTSIEVFYCSLPKETQLHYINSHIYILGIYHALRLYSAFKRGKKPEMPVTLQQFQYFHPSSLKRTQISRLDTDSYNSFFEDTHKPILLHKHISNTLNNSFFFRFFMRFIAVCTHNAFTPLTTLPWSFTPNLLRDCLNKIQSSMGNLCYPNYKSVLQAKSNSPIATDDKFYIGSHFSSFVMKGVSMQPLQKFFPCTPISIKINANVRDVHALLELFHTQEKVLEAKLKAQFSQLFNEDANPALATVPTIYPCLLKKITPFSQQQDTVAQTEYYLTFITISDPENLLQTIYDEEYFSRFDPHTFLRKLERLIFNPPPSSNLNQAFSSRFCAYTAEEKLVFAHSLNYLIGFLAASSAYVVDNDAKHILNVYPSYLPRASASNIKNFGLPTALYQAIDHIPSVKTLLQFNHLFVRTANEAFPYPSINYDIPHGHVLNHLIVNIKTKSSKQHFYKPITTESSKAS